MPITGLKSDKIRLWARTIDEDSKQTVIERLEAWQSTGDDLMEYLKMSHDTSHDHHMISKLFIPGRAGLRVSPRTLVCLAALSCGCTVC